MELIVLYYLSMKLPPFLKEKYGKYLLMVSRFQYPHKDQFTVIKAFNILIKKNKIDSSLLFIGDGPDRKKAENLANSLDPDVRKRIHFLGTKLDVQNYYTAAFALVHASVAGEGLPTIMIEAMNYNLPEVVTDSKTGPREILGDSQYGLLCKVKDPKDMSEKIYRLYTNPNLYKHFSPNHIEKKLKSILQDVSGKNYANN